MCVHDIIIPSYTSGPGAVEHLLQDTNVYNIYGFDIHVYSLR